MYDGARLVRKLLAVSQGAVLHEQDVVGEKAVVQKRRGELAVRGVYEIEHRGELALIPEAVLVLNAPVVHEREERVLRARAPPVVRDIPQLMSARLHRARHRPGRDRLAVHARFDRLAEPVLEHLYGVVRVAQRARHVEDLAAGHIILAERFLRRDAELLEIGAEYLREAHLVDAVNVVEILSVLHAAAAHRGVGKHRLHGDIAHADIALRLAAAHILVPVRLPEGVAELQKAALVARVHVGKAVVLGDVPHGKFAPLGHGAVKIVVTPAKFRLRHSRFDLALDEDIRIGNARRKPRDVVLTAELGEIARHIVDAVVVIVVLFPLDLHGGAGVFGAPEERVRRPLARRAVGIIVAGNDLRLRLFLS